MHHAIVVVYRRVSEMSRRRFEIDSFDSNQFRNFRNCVYILLFYFFEKRAKRVPVRCTV
jgi:hypothetical protein